MRRALLLLACCIAGALQAQISVQVSLNHDRFLVYEGIPLTVRIQNNTSSPLLIGGSNSTARLRIDVQDTNGQSVPVTEQMVLPDTWYIPSGGTGTNSFNLVSLFSIREADSFRARIFMTPLGDTTYASNVVLFDVVNGAELEALRFAREDRAFRLVELNRNRSNELLLQVSSANRTRTYSTYVLDRYLRFYPPVMKRDGEGRIHTLHYRDNRVVVHCVFDRKGIGLIRQYYQVQQGAGVRADLVPGGEFGMQVAGGKPLRR
jgi:hypothetical protein